MKRHKTYEQIVREVKEGLLGNAVSRPTRRRRLEAAGYDYHLVQAMINNHCRTEAELIRKLERGII